MPGTSGSPTLIKQIAVMTNDGQNTVTLQNYNAQVAAMQAGQPITTGATGIKTDAMAQKIFEAAGLKYDKDAKKVQLTEYNLGAKWRLFYYLKGKGDNQTYFLLLIGHAEDNDLEVYPSK